MESIRFREKDFDTFLRASMMSLNENLFNFLVTQIFTSYTRTEMDGKLFKTR